MHHLKKCKSLIDENKFLKLLSYRIRPPKNVIIEYEQSKAHHEQIITDEGVFRADPQTHNATSTMG